MINNMWWTKSHTNNHMKVTAGQNYCICDVNHCTVLASIWDTEFFAVVNLSVFLGKVRFPAAHTALYIECFAGFYFFYLAIKLTIFSKCCTINCNILFHLVTKVTFFFFFFKEVLHHQLQYSIFIWLCKWLFLTRYCTISK